jgi:Coenzyme PQQ synthesis protein D (PqqD)
MVDPIAVNGTRSARQDSATRLTQPGGMIARGIMQMTEKEMDISDLSARIALSKHAVCRQTTNGLVMLFDREKGVMYELNETAAKIVQLLSERSRDNAELVAELSAEFNAPDGVIADEVHKFTSDFLSAELLQSGAAVEG